jgi:hypothetical protein
MIQYPLRVRSSHLYVNQTKPQALQADWKININRSNRLSSVIAIRHSFNLLPNKIETNPSRQGPEILFKIGLHSFSLYSLNSLFNGSLERCNEPSGPIKYGMLLSGCTTGGLSSSAQLHGDREWRVQQLFCLSSHIAWDTYFAVK